MRWAAAEAVAGSTPAGGVCWWIMERVSVLVDPATAKILRQIAEEQGIRPRGPGPLAATVRWLVAQYAEQKAAKGEA